MEIVVPQLLKKVTITCIYLCQETNKQMVFKIYKSIGAAAALPTMSLLTKSLTLAIALRLPFELFQTQHSCVDQHRVNYKPVVNFIGLNGCQFTHLTPICLESLIKNTTLTEILITFDTSQNVKRILHKNQRLINIETNCSRSFC